MEEVPLFMQLYLARGKDGISYSGRNDKQKERMGEGQ